MKSKNSPKGSASKRADSGLRKGGHGNTAVVLDFVQSRIEAFNREQGGGVSVTKDPHGYTLLREDTGMPVARLRPREKGRRFEVMCWSRDRECWRPVGMMGTTVLALDDALDLIARDPMDCFWY